MIDLHCHSSHSDGVHTPAELVQMAENAGLSALALTDHDTVNGIDPFLAAGAGRRLRVVPGVEIACQGEGNAILHVVGLWVDHRNRALGDLLEEIRTDRRRRNAALLARLDALGCPLDPAEIEAAAGGGVVGRPHVAQALVARGYCRSHQDAFERFLGRGKPAYIRRRITPVEKALAVLSAAGAVCIWAHPLTSNSITAAALRRALKRLGRLGLDGLEVYYPDYTETQTRTALDAAAELAMLPSGGSDFHGSNIPGIALGTGRGNLAVPDALLPPLEERARQKAAATRPGPGTGQPASPSG